MLKRVWEGMATAVWGSSNSPPPHPPKKEVNLSVIPLMSPTAQDILFHLLKATLYWVLWTQGGKQRYSDLKPGGALCLAGPWQPPRPTHRPLLPTTALPHASQSWLHWTLLSYYHWSLLKQIWRSITLQYTVCFTVEQVVMRFNTKTAASSLALHLTSTQE